MSTTTPTRRWRDGPIRRGADRDGDPVRRRPAPRSRRAAALARWLVDHGNDGLVVAGTTGEGATLSDGEKLDLWRAVSEAVTDPVIAGTGTNDTRHTAELTSKARDVGAAGVLVVTPVLQPPSQAGLEAHFRAAAAATDLPVLIYDIPIRTGRKVAHDVLVRLVARGRQHRRREGRRRSTCRHRHGWRPRPRGGFEIYSGNDDQTLPLLAVGAVGVIGVCTHWAAPEMAEMIAAFAKGDVTAAREHNARLLPSYAFETSDAAPNPVPTKAMMDAPRPAGRGVPACRWDRRRTGSPTGPARCSPGWGGRRHEVEAGAMSSPVTVTFLGGLGEVGRNCACFEADGRDRAARLRADVPQPRHDGDRPRPARLHLPS